MLECLIFITLAGGLLASKPGMGMLNPFQVYFFVWLIIVLGYYFLQSNFISVSFEFLLLMIAAKSFALFILVCVCVSSKVYAASHAEIPDFKLSRVQLVWVLVLVGLPFVFQKASYLADGYSLFSSIGYMRLRAALSSGVGGYGIASYFLPLALVVSSIELCSYKAGKSSLARLCLSLLISLAYCYLATGRTYVLLLGVLMVSPLIIVKAIELRWVVFLLISFIFMYVFVTAMTAKGVSLDAGFYENVATFWLSLQSYIIAPLLAFSIFFENWSGAEFGLNTFRFFISVFYKLGLVDYAPAVLVRDYETVPNPTNVYTVYEVYFRDFWYVGGLLPPLFLVFHWWLYCRANKDGGVWVLLYSTSIYPLILQFFQDQYFSMLSTWIQIVFWYWFLVVPSHTRKCLEKINA